MRLSFLSVHVFRCGDGKSSIAVYMVSLEFSLAIPLPSTYMEQLQSDCVADIKCVCVCVWEMAVNPPTVRLLSSSLYLGIFFTALTLSQRGVGGRNDNHGWVCEITAVCLYVPESLCVHFCMFLSQRVLAVCNCSLMSMRGSQVCAPVCMFMPPAWLWLM